MIAYKCDICGEFVNGAAMNSFDMIKWIDGKQRKLKITVSADYCPKCIRDIVTTGEMKLPSTVRSGYGD